MKLTKFMLLSRNIRWTVIYVIKGNNEINEIYVIKAKFKILVIVNLWLFLYVQLLCFVTYFGVFVLQLSTSQKIQTKMSDNKKNIKF